MHFGWAARSSGPCVMPRWWPRDLRTYPVLRIIHFKLLDYTLHMQERGKYEKLYNEAVDGSIGSNAKASDAQAKSLADVRMMYRFSLASRVRVHSLALL